MDKIIIHEDFKDSVYDIALLKLGKKNQFFIYLSMSLQLSAWISQSSTLPVFPLMMKSLLARKDLFMVRTDQIKDVKYCTSVSGWGDTGVQETSTEKLQESEVQIVPSDICTQKMKSTDIDDNLVVCAGGNKKGPCKVFTTTMFVADAKH